MAYATPGDVEKRLGRELDASEAQIVDVRLDDAERLIRLKIADLDSKVTSGVLDIDSVIMVEADAVLRLIRNPDGYLEETDGNYSYSISQQVASGRLEILADEWRLLGVRAGAFVIRPYLSPPINSAPYPWWC